MNSYLQKTLEEIQRATAGMTAEQLTWHPQGKWSSAEILEHLTLTFSGTVKGMRKVLASGSSGAPKRTWKNRLFTLVVADLGYMPPGRQAPQGTVPAGASANPVETIYRSLTEMDGALTDVEDKKGPRARVSHPILGPLTVQQWRKFHLVHTKHHMRQIVKLRQLAS